MKYIVHRIAAGRHLVQFGSDEDPENDQDATFTGEGDEDRAIEYAAFKNAQRTEREILMSELADVPVLNMAGKEA